MSGESKIDFVIAGRARDLGGFSVHRILPYMMHRMVGPFIFFDHMGPATLEAGEGMAVRPHPHINLATVTYLFEGVIEHRDSLGSDQLIEAGAINWMTAGRGIVHSERTPEAELGKAIRMNGIQLWVALPEEMEESDPSFAHHPKDSLPSFSVNGVAVKLLLGTAFGQESPVKVHSDMFYAEARMNKGQSLLVPGKDREIAIYCVDGAAKVEDVDLEPFTMAVAKAGVDVTVSAKTDTRLMLIGGKALGRRHIYWNFVSSSKERIEAAKIEWKPGPRAASSRFQPIPGDDKEFIPLPDEPRPKPTVM